MRPHASVKWTKAGLLTCAQDSLTFPLSGHDLHECFPAEQWTCLHQAFTMDINITQYKHAVHHIGLLLLENVNKRFLWSPLVPTQLNIQEQRNRKQFAEGGVADKRRQAEMSEGWRPVVNKGEVFKCRPYFMGRSIMTRCPRLLSDNKGEKTGKQCANLRE